MAAVIGSNIKKYNPKIIGQKSLWGSVSCVFFTILSISVLSLVFGIGLSFLEILILGIIVGVLEMISGKYDNISIPFCVMGLSYIFLR